MKLSEIMASQPPVRHIPDARRQIRKSLVDSGKRLVVIDDDPTGVQTIHGVSVFMDWSVEVLRKAIVSQEPVFFISTNSRSLNPVETQNLSLEVGRNLREAARLEGAEFGSAHLEGADFTVSIVDGLTLFWKCSVDRKTNFRGVGLDSCRMDEPTKYLLEYNKRRMNCEAWYKQHPRLAWPVKAFFWMSDYGRSTGRIIFTFFGLALIFAGIYYLYALVNSPGIVSNLFEGNDGPVPGWLVPFRTIYFSIVTMTTLGFGDMHADCRSLWGHLLLTVQVILGYVLLAALVTRIGVLFTSGVIPGQLKKSGKKPEREEQPTRA